MTYFQFAGCHGWNGSSVASPGPASTVWPGKWDPAVKSGMTPHLPALLNTPLLYEANLLPDRAGSSVWDVPKGGLFFPSRQADPVLLSIPEGEFEVTSPEKSILLCSQPPSCYHPALLTRGCRWLIEPSGRPRGVCGAGHTRLRPLEAGGDGSLRLRGSDTHGAQAWQRSVSEGSDARCPGAL